MVECPRALARVCVCTDVNVWRASHTAMLPANLRPPPIMRQNACSLTQGSAAAEDGAITFTDVTSDAPPEASATAVTEAASVRTDAAMDIEQPRRVAVSELFPRKPTAAELRQIVFDHAVFSPPTQEDGRDGVHLDLRFALKVTETRVKTIGTFQLRFMPEKTQIMGVKSGKDCKHVFIDHATKSSRVRGVPFETHALNVMQPSCQEQSALFCNALNGVCKTLLPNGVRDRPSSSECAPPAADEYDALRAHAMFEFFRARFDKTKNPVVVISTTPEEAKSNRQRVLQLLTWFKCFDENTCKDVRELRQDLTKQLVRGLLSPKK